MVGFKARSVVDDVVMGGAYSALPHRLTHNKKVIPVITRMSNSRSTSISVTQFRSMIGRGGGLVPTCWA